MDVGSHLPKVLSGNGKQQVQEIEIGEEEVLHTAYSRLKIVLSFNRRYLSVLSGKSRPGFHSLADLPSFGIKIPCKSRIPAENIPISKGGRNEGYTRV